MRTFAWLGCLCVTCLLAGCGDGHSGQPGPGAGGAGGATSADDPLVATDTDLAFDDATLWTFELTATPEDVAWLHANAQLEQSIRAQLTVAGHPMGEVGLRYKGNVGTLENCFDETGQQICDKLSMKIVFDEFQEDTRFFGLKRLNFHALTYDASLMRDRLAYGLFRDLGVAASRATHARLMLNGEYLGVFSMVEQVDGRFTDYHFPGNGDGNVYKERWPTSTDDAYYTAGLKTNEDAVDNSGMLAFAGAILAASDADLPGVLAQYSDVDTLMRYMAVDRAISNADGITAWYSGSWGSVNHNYYWYQDEAAPRFTLIPWDLHYTFELNTPFDGVPAWDDLDPDCGLRYPAFSPDVPVRAPTCDPVMRGLALLDRSRYLAAVQELLDGPFQIDALNAKLDQWSSQIAEAVATDPNGPGQEGWEGAVARLRADLSWLRQRTQNVRDGVSTTPMAIVVPGPNDFEATDPLTFVLGARGMCNSASTLRYAPNQVDPLAGLVDARIDFEFRNQSEVLPDGAWQQWAAVNFDLAGAETDLVAAGITSIRFVARADQARRLRVDIESPSNSQSSAGICIGWDVALTPEPQTITVQLADGAIPGWAASRPNPPTDDPAAVYARATGLVLRPQTVGVQPTGLFPSGVTDPGFVEIDDVEFL
jgi:spore coat protein H